MVTVATWIPSGASATACAWARARSAAFWTPRLAMPRKGRSAVPPPVTRTVPAPSSRIPGSTARTAVCRPMAPTARSASRSSGVRSGTATSRPTETLYSRTSTGPTAVTNPSIVPVRAAGSPESAVAQAASTPSSRSAEPSSASACSPRATSETTKASPPSLRAVAAEIPGPAPTTSRCATTGLFSGFSSGVQPERLHPLGVRVGDPLDQPGDACEVPGAGDDQLGQPVMLGNHCLRPRDRLADEPATPEGQPAGDLPVGGDRRAHLTDGEVGVTGVGEDLQDQPAVRVGQEGGDLPVEVGGQPIADIGLDQPLEPRARPGALVEGVQGRDERRHRVGRLHAELGEPVGEPYVVGDLGRGHPGQRRPTGQLRGEPGVLGQSIEGGELGVGQHPQEVDDGSTVDRGHAFLLGSVAAVWWAHLTLTSGTGDPHRRARRGYPVLAVAWESASRPVCLCICALTTTG